MSGRIVHGVGPRYAKIVIVGEAPGANEEASGTPFCGAAGYMLDELLEEAGIQRQECFIVNCFRFRPVKNDITTVYSKRKKDLPAANCQEFGTRWATREFIEHVGLLRQELESIKPNVVIALGDVALSVLCGVDGITTWRGSELNSTLVPGLKVIPTYHPAAILRQYSWRWIALNDLRRAERESKSPEIVVPEFRFILRPDFSTVISTLDLLQAKVDREPTKLSVDLETRHQKIACVGIAWTVSDAISIPFLAIGRYNGYWTGDQAVEIVKRLRGLLRHPNAQVIGQNFIYDAQYLARWFGFAPIPWMDTMIAFHTCFLRAQKALDFIASITNDHYRYWKDDGKLWDPRKQSEDQLWYYNCEDCVRTLEAALKIEQIAAALGVSEAVDRQHSRFGPILRMMLRGVRFRTDFKEAIEGELKAAVAEREKQIHFLASRPLNPESPKQLQDYFYSGLGIEPVKNRKTGGVTCDESALLVIARREPIAKRLCHSIIQHRQLSNSLSVVNTKLDVDGRIRCSYNIAGTATTRLASRENAFGSGTNLQNWTKGVKPKDSSTGLGLPNLRSLLGPDPGMVIVEADQNRADLQVVVWEANDDELKQALRENVDIHSLNAITLFSLRCEIDQVKERYPQQRHIAKAWCHGTNYAGQANTMAKVAGITVAQSENLRKRWFQMHPGIAEWHERTRSQLRATGFVTNPFGYKCFFFDRIDEVLPEALAWIPQSVVAIITNDVIGNLDRHHSDLLEILLQTHDSITFQTPAKDYLSTFSTIYPSMLITVPYDDPLVIPWTFSVSDKSWGDVQEVDFEHHS